MVRSSNPLLPMTFSHSLCVLLELKEEESYAETGTLARKHGIPPSYLAKMLQILRRAGVLESQRGPKGGFRLARAAHLIFLADILAPFQPQGTPDCLVQKGPCKFEDPCVLDLWWEETRVRMDHMLRTTTLRDLQLTKERREQTKLHVPMT